MARVKNRHKLDGFGGKVGKHLDFASSAEGKVHLDTVLQPSVEHHINWQLFKDAVAYARKAKVQEEYREAAASHHTTPFKVATADFLHPPEIREIDLADYHGKPGDVIRVHAVDDVKVAQVGILIVDHENCLLEMGMAENPDGGEIWRYVATVDAPGHHVRVIVDAADLPGHLAEARAKKKI
jgi:hypothetical protein